MPRRESPSSSGKAFWGANQFCQRYQQYHFALLLLLDIFNFPMRKEADRLWKSLDYVFDVPPHIPKDQKARWVMTEVRDKMGIYISARRVIAPASMLERMPAPRSSTGTSPSPSASSASAGNPRHNSSTSNEFSSIGSDGSNYHGSLPNIVKTEPVYNTKPGQDTVSMPMQAMKDDQMIDIDWVSLQSLIEICV